jgi:hypothetical protein
VITYDRVQVTPALAKKWLGMNAENNRLPKHAKIPSYARDMLTGRWNPNTGETIKFDENGVLVDGQNRLHAVIDAGIAVEFDVARGLPSSAMQVIDTGAARTNADVLKIAGAAERGRTASIVRWVILWDLNVFTGAAGTIRPTNTEILDRYRQESGAFDAATRRATDCQKRGLGTGTPAGVAHFLFSRVDVESTHQFFDQYISGANLPERSAVLALRNKMARIRIDRLSRAEQLALFVRSWNAFRERRTVDRLQLTRSGELGNLNFPMPK